MRPGTTVQPVLDSSAQQALSIWAVGCEYALNAQDASERQQ
jgi:hypothetical protein